MLEIPEAIVLAEQLNRTIKGKHIKGVVAALSPHKFAFYYEDPAEYDALLSGRVVGNTTAYGGRVEINLGDAVVHFGDGANLRYYAAGEEIPAKHQLLVAFEDNSALVATVAMYGGLWAFPVGAMDDNFYYAAAKNAISPLSDEFSYEYFLRLFDEKKSKISAKAFLATEQRIPGLGNGVLQDVLFNAKIHPKRKMDELSDVQGLFSSVKSTLAEMVAFGGRDTERDLLGNYGGYKAKLSKNTLLSPCLDCGGQIKKETYLGGSIYFCEECQEK